MDGSSSLRTVVCAIVLMASATHAALFEQDAMVSMLALVLSGAALVVSAISDRRASERELILPMLDTSHTGQSAAPKFCSSAPVHMATAPRRNHHLTTTHAYVPDGLTPEQYKKLKEKEKKKQDLGKIGARGYKSRSFQSFQEALERGEASHLMPVDPRDVKSGKIPIEEVPYMQRGGAWDGSDVKGFARIRAQAKQAQFKASGGKKGAYTAGKWLQSDKDYANGGEKKAQQYGGFFGMGGGAKKEEMKVDSKMTDQDMWRYSGATNMGGSSKSKKAAADPAPKKKNIFGF